MSRARSGIRLLADLRAEVRKRDHERCVLAALLAQVPGQDSVSWERRRSLAIALELEQARARREREAAQAAEEKRDYQKLKKRRQRARNKVAKHACSQAPERL